jgi:glyoxylase-like metal-dependent hydrolase (beta-lactamase superfamily II)
VSSVLINPTGTTLQDPRNAPADAVVLNFDVPDVAKNATIPAPTVTAQEIGKGIQYLTGGTHHSVAIEMKDHVILVEAPLDEARSNVVVAKVKELFPTKPIKYVINTHAHFDHSGGLRTLVAEGATVVTHQANRPYYEKAWMAPHTIEPDKLAQTKKIATFLTFTNKQVLTDGVRTVEVHRIAGNPHNDAFAMVYLPAEKLLIEADAYTPPAPPAPAQGGGAAAAAGGGRAGSGPAGAAAEGGARAGGGGGRGAAPAAPAAPPPPNPSTVNLYENIQKLKLDVAQIAPLHGNRLATMDDLKQASTPAQPAGTGQ